MPRSRQSRSSSSASRRMAGTNSDHTLFGSFNNNTDRSSAEGTLFGSFRSDSSTGRSTRATSSSSSTVFGSMPSPHSSHKTWDSDSSNSSIPSSPTLSIFGSAAPLSPSTAYAGFGLSAQRFGGVAGFHAQPCGPSPPSGCYAHPLAQAPNVRSALYPASPRRPTGLPYDPLMGGPVWPTGLPCGPKGPNGPMRMPVPPVGSARPPTRMPSPPRSIKSHGSGILPNIPGGRGSGTCSSSSSSSSSTCSSDVSISSSYYSGGSSSSGSSKSTKSSRSSNSSRSSSTSSSRSTSTSSHPTKKKPSTPAPTGPTKVPPPWCGDLPPAPPLDKWDGGPAITPKKNGGWQCEGRNLKNHRSQKYFVRPVDGKRKGYWGRLKDGMTGSGPDVFVVAAADSSALHASLPGHDRWSNWDSLGGPFESRSCASASSSSSSEDEETEEDFSLDLPWFGANRYPGKVYNFRTRRYENVWKRAPEHYWSGAAWPKQGREQHRGSSGSQGLPCAVRDVDGVWEEFSWDAMLASPMYCH